MNEEHAVFPGNGPLAVPSETGSPGSQTPAESASRREFLEFWAGYGRFYRLYSCQEDKAARRELESLFRRGGNLLSGAGIRLSPAQRDDVKKYLRLALDSSCFGSDPVFQEAIGRLCGAETDLSGEEVLFQKIRDYGIAGEEAAGEGMDFVSDAESIARGFRISPRRAGSGLNRYILKTGILLMMPLVLLAAVLFVLL